MRVGATGAATQAVVRETAVKRQGAGGFAEALDQARREAQVRFSAHARQRMAAHSLQVDAALERQLGRALEIARAKGIRQGLVVTGGANWILSVPHQTVITVVPGGQSNPGVFTNIDGAVLLD